MFASEAKVAMTLVLCVSREGFGEFSADYLTLGRLYEVLAPVDGHGMLRIIDDSGEALATPRGLPEVTESQSASR